MTQAILITGGTGLIGGRAVPVLAERSEIRLLSRRPGSSSIPNTRTLEWNGVDVPDEALRGASTVIHLAGEPVFGGLPTKRRLDRILKSRVDSTAALVARLSSLPDDQRPDSLVSASAVGFYGDRGDERLDEDAVRGEGFLADVCVDWEAEAVKAEALGLRVVRLRFGIVLARDGGALSLMAPVFRAGLAGNLGSGKQWFPWVHIDDAAAMLVRATEDTAWTGAVNVVAPEPVRNAELTRVLAKQLKRPAFLTAPAFAVRAALGPLSDELLGSKCVVPGVAQALGFDFTHGQLSGALADLFGKSA